MLIEGPWDHKFVSANGARFHVAVAGEGPLVLLLHGFPQFWYAWRHQLVALADAGYQAAAVDLRGFGASDKPPKGYDIYTASGDAAAVIRSLGAEEAVVVGHGLGGATAWAMPTLRPEVTRAIGALGMPHPIVAERACLFDSRQRAAAAYIARMQVPFRSERTLVESDEEVRGYLTGWAAPGGAFPAEEDVSRYAGALALPFVAHSAAEYYRWFGRNQLRWDGPALRRRLRRPIEVPVLRLHGELDGCFLEASTRGSGRYVAGPLTERVVPEAGHFLAEESPEVVTDALVAWLATLPTAGPTAGPTTATGTGPTP